MNIVPDPSLAQNSEAKRHRDVGDIYPPKRKRGWENTQADEVQLQSQPVSNCDSIAFAPVNI